MRPCRALHANLTQEYTAGFFTVPNNPLCADICGQTGYALSYQAVRYLPAPGSLGCPLACVSPCAV